MNNIDVVLSCVDSAGANWIPVKMASLNVANIQAHYSNRKLFGDDKELMLIEQVQTEDKKVWMYYEYLLYGIFDASCRPGSFISLTVITDTLCADTKLMLDLCRKAFNKYLVGKLLQPKDETFQISDALSAQENVRVEIENSFADILVKYQDLGMLEDVPVSASPMPYQPLSLNNEKQVLCRLNPVDAAPAKIKELIQAGKKIAVSDNYPSLAQQQLENEKTGIAGELDRCKNQLADTQTSLENANKQAAEARNQNRKLQDEITSLKDGNSRNSKKWQDEMSRKTKEFEEKIKKYEAQGNYAMQVQLDKIVNMLQAQQQSKQSKQLVPPVPPGPKPIPPKPKDDKKIIKPMIIIGAFVVVVIVAILLLVTMCSSGKSKGREDDDKKEKSEYFVEEASNDFTQGQSTPSALTNQPERKLKDNGPKSPENEPAKNEQKQQDNKLAGDNKKEQQQAGSKPIDEEIPIPDHSTLNLGNEE